MGMHVTVELTCDKCENVIDHSDQFQMYESEMLGDMHWDTDMVLQEDGEWYCQDCDTSLESEEDN